MMKDKEIKWVRGDKDNNGDYEWSFKAPDGKVYSCYRSPAGDDFSCVIREPDELDGEVICWVASLASAKEVLTREYTNHKNGGSPH